MPDEIDSRCGSPCSRGLIYRPNVEREDGREALCITWNKLGDETYNPVEVICDGCQAQLEGGGKVCFSAGHCTAVPA